MKLDMETKPQSTDIIRWFCSFNDLSYEEICRHPGGLKVQCRPDTVTASDPDHGARMDVCPPDVAIELSESLTRLSTTSVESSGFPFRLTCRRMLETMNSVYSENTRTRKRYKLNPVFMNPQDMKSVGVEEGQRVRVSSAVGTLTGLAKADKTMRLGVVAISHMWGTLEGQDPDDAYSGRLVSIDENVQNINYMPMFSGIPVAIDSVETE